MLSVNNLFGELAWDFQALPHGAFGGQLAACLWVKVDWLHSVLVTGRLCCLGPQCAEWSDPNFSFKISDMPLSIFY